MGQSVDVGVSELHSAAARLSDAAQRLKDGLSSVDDEAAQLLGSGWQGGAASAYAPVWEKWHGGAEQVVEGLQRMSELLAIAGREYAKSDDVASGALDSTMQGSGGSEGNGGGRASGGGVGQASGSAEGRQQAMAEAMQLGQVAGQPLSQVERGATGLAQTIAGLAGEVIQGVEAAEGDQDRQAETPDGSAAESAAIGRRAELRRDVGRPGE